MAYGCFVDIAQQDGTLVRMMYENKGRDISLRRTVEWMGIMEATAEKFNEQRIGERP